MRKTWRTVIGCMLAAAMLAGCSSGSSGTGETSGAASQEATEAAAEETTAEAEEEAASSSEEGASANSEYPERPVTAVVAWGVGGGQDLMVRTVANYFKDYANGQSMVISNIEGGSSVQGVTEYIGYEEDGYNLLSWATAQTIKTQMQETN